MRPNPTAASRAGRRKLLHAPRGPLARQRGSATGASLHLAVTKLRQRGQALHGSELCGPRRAQRGAVVDGAPEAALELLGGGQAGHTCPARVENCREVS